MMKKHEKRPVTATKKDSDTGFGENPYRRVFNLSRNDCDWLIDNSGSQSDLNNVWQELGRKHGFVWTTVREIVGGDIAVDGIWMITAEVESIVPGLDDGELERFNWLFRERFALSDAIMSIMVAACGLIYLIAL